MNIGTMFAFINMHLNIFNNNNKNDKQDFIDLEKGLNFAEENCPSYSININRIEKYSIIDDYISFIDCINYFASNKKIIPIINTSIMDFEFENSNDDFKTPLNQNPNTEK